VSTAIYSGSKEVNSAYLPLFTSEVNSAYLPLFTTPLHKELDAQASVLKESPAFCLEKEVGIQLNAGKEVSGNIVLHLSKKARQPP
jgi:hypothetical protein